MSSDFSEISCPFEDKFAPFHEFEKSLCNEIALCSDVDKKEQLTWKLATFYLETARPDKAIAHLRWILETTRNEESKKDSLHTLQYLIGSEEITPSISEESLNLPDVLWQLASAFLRKRHQQPGVLCLLRLIDISSDREQRAECFFLLGAESEKSDDHDAAAQFYQGGIECGPKEIRTRYFLHNNFGYCLNKLGRHDEAESACREAIEIDPRRYNAYKNLGIALQGQGEFSEAAALFLEAAFLHPLDPRSLGHLEEILADHREEVEREIPDIAMQIAGAIEARNKMIQ